MPKITIKGTTIDFPASAAAPNYAPAIIQTVQSLADAVNTFAGTFDVAPQKITIDTYNPGTNIPVDNLVFPPSDVRAASIFYAIFRTTANSGPLDGVNLDEAGTLEIIYDSARPATQKWGITRMSTGDAGATFTITDLGQILLTTSTVTGISHTGILSYRALAILNS